MEIEITTMIFTFINIAVIVAIIIGIIKGIKVLGDFINRSKQMDKKLDSILDKLEKMDNE